MATVQTMNRKKKNTGALPPPSPTCRPLSDVPPIENAQQMAGVVQLVKYGPNNGKTAQEMVQNSET